MPDYNIYIHSMGNGGSRPQNPTVPWKKEEKESSTPTVSWKDAVSQIGGIVNNPDSLVHIGVSAVMKAIPYVVIAKLVIDTATRIYETALDFKTIRTGDYAESLEWNRVKTIFSGMMSPFSTGLNEWKIAVRNSIENDRRIKKLELLGDSVINSYFKRGV